jgi:hypothetical protein
MSIHIYEFTGNWKLRIMYVLFYTAVIIRVPYVTRLKIGMKVSSARYNYVDELENILYFENLIII